MADKKLVALIQRLRDKTIEGKISWEKTLSPEIFQASFPGYSVHISSLEADIMLSIYDEDGVLLEEIKDTNFKATDFNSEHPYFVMYTIYSLARRSALGVDKALDKLLSELE